MQAVNSTRPGGFIGYVGVPHGVSLDGEQLFFSHVHLHGGPAPVRRYLPHLINLVLNGRINPGRSLTWCCRWIVLRTATEPWTRNVRSKRCCVLRRDVGTRYPRRVTETGIT
jgi:hypothetical protein